MITAQRGNEMRAEKACVQAWCACWDGLRAKAPCNGSASVRQASIFDARLMAVGSWRASVLLAMCPKAGEQNCGSPTRRFAPFGVNGAMKIRAYSLDPRLAARGSSPRAQLPSLAELLRDSSGSISVRTGIARSQGDDEALLELRGLLCSAQMAGIDKPYPKRAAGLAASHCRQSSMWPCEP